MRYDLKAPHPQSPSVDHLPGFEVERMVGHPVWEARIHLCDIDGLAPACYGCNASSGNDHRLANPYRNSSGGKDATRATPEPEPLTPMAFRNITTGDIEVFYVNDRSIVSDDWEAA
jgi:hypothetical protein